MLVPFTCGLEQPRRLRRNCDRELRESSNLEGNCTGCESWCALASDKLMQGFSKDGRDQNTPIRLAGLFRAFALPDTV